MSYAASRYTNDIYEDYGEENQTWNSYWSEDEDSCNYRSWRPQYGERPTARRNLTNIFRAIENARKQQTHREEPRQAAIPPPPGLDVKPHSEVLLLSAPPGFEHVHPVPLAREELIKAILEQKKEKEIVENEFDKEIAASEQWSEKYQNKVDELGVEFRKMTFEQKQRNRRFQEQNMRDNRGQLLDCGEQRRQA